MRILKYTKSTLLNASLRMSFKAIVAQFQVGLSSKEISTFENHV